MTTIPQSDEPMEIVYYLEFPDGTKWGTRDGKPFSSRAHAATQLKKIIEGAEQALKWAKQFEDEEKTTEYETQLAERKSIEIVAYKLVKMVLN